MRKYVLLAAGLLAVAAFLALTAMQQGRAPVTSTPVATSPVATTPTATAAPTPTATPTSTPVATSPVATTPTATAAPTPTATPTQTAAPAARLQVALRAPPAVNVTALPARINYTVVVTNVGNAAASVTVDGLRYSLGPGQRVEVARWLEVRAAGEYRVESLVNGTAYSATIKVYYLAPRLEAQPVTVNVTRLPARLTLNIKIRNVGNYTGRVGGLEVRPGAAVTINATLDVAAAGVYYVQVDGLQVPISVRLYTGALRYSLTGPQQVEAVPGENYTVVLTLANAGNGTARVKVDGVPVDLQPGQAVNFTRRIAVTRAGVYTAEFRLEGDLNATVRHSFKAALVVPRVEFVLWNTMQRRYPQPGSQELVVVEVGQRDVQLSLGYYLRTNATARRVTLAVEGPGGLRLYSVGPGEAVGANFTASLTAPGSATLEIRVNGTPYVLAIEARLAAPRITVSSTSSMDFVDSRYIQALEISCTSPRQGAIKFNLVKVGGSMQFGQQVSLSGYVTISDLSGSQTYTGQYSGQYSGGRGSATLGLLGHQIYLEFEVSGGVRITRMLVDGTEYVCRVPTELIPPALYSGIPTAQSEPADSYARRLIAALARGPDDRPQEWRWTGDHVEVRDMAGRIYRVYIRQGQIRIEGPLEATIAGEISLQ